MLRSLLLWWIIHAQITVFMMHDTCSDHCVYDAWYMLISLRLWWMIHAQITAFMINDTCSDHYFHNPQRHSLTIWSVCISYGLQQVYFQSAPLVKTHSGIISQAFVVQTCSKFIQNLLQTWLAVATYLWCVKMRMPPQTKSGRNLR